MGSFQNAWRACQILAVPAELLNHLIPFLIFSLSLMAQLSGLVCKSRYDLSWDLRTPKSLVLTDCQQHSFSLLELKLGSASRATGLPYRALQARVVEEQSPLPHTGTWSPWSRTSISSLIPSHGIPTELTPWVKLEACAVKPSSG